MLGVLSAAVLELIEKGCPDEEAASQASISRFIPEGVDCQGQASDARP